MIEALTVVSAVVACACILQAVSRGAAGADRYDEHWTPPPPCAPVPRALLRGPDNDELPAHDAETQPASRKRNQVAA